LISDHKREDDDFQSYVNSYDIVAFAETLNDSPGNPPEFTSLYFTKPTKRKRHGRPSGGIAVYCKPSIRRGVTEVQISNFSIWLKLDKTLLGLSKTTFLGICYIKPYSTKEESELIFTKLQSEILKFKEQGELLICGDFNARTSGLNDYIQNDEINDHIAECPLPSDYPTDIPIQKAQLDDHFQYFITNFCYLKQYISANIIIVLLFPIVVICRLTWKKRSYNLRFT
jgi:hypothetical protein